MCCKQIIDFNNMKYNINKIFMESIALFVNSGIIINMICTLYR